MKRFSTFLIAALTLFCSNADPLEWTHPKVDVHPAECDCTVGAEGVIYHSMSYPSTPPTYYGSWVTFVSENEGDPVTISFTDFNCMRNSKPVVFVYDGDAELQANFTGYTKPAPEGYLAAITPENAAAEYTANSGKLCVLYAPQQAGSGSITIEIHRDAITEDDIVVLHDDVLATGGTMAAAYELVKRMNPKKIYINFIIELGMLNGRANLPADAEVTSLIKY